MIMINMITMINSIIGHICLITGFYITSVEETSLFFCGTCVLRESRDFVCFLISGVTKTTLYKII